MGGEDRGPWRRRFGIGRIRLSTRSTGRRSGRQGRRRRRCGRACRQRRRTGPWRTRSGRCRLRQMSARMASSWAGGIAQAVQVWAGRAGGRLVEGGVDVVRPGLGAADGEPAPAQRSGERQRHRGLAGARPRRADVSARAVNAGTPSVRASRRSRTATISPIDDDRRGWAGRRRPGRRRCGRGWRRARAAGGGGGGDRRGGGVGVMPAAAASGRSPDLGDRHVEDERLAELGERVPVDRCRAGRSLPRRDRSRGRAPGSRRAGRWDQRRR